MRADCAHRSGAEVGQAEILVLFYRPMFVSMFDKNGTNSKQECPRFDRRARMKLAALLTGATRQRPEIQA